MGLFGGGNSSTSVSYQTNNTNETFGVTGAGGDGPTLGTTSGAITYNDAGGQVSMDAIAGMRDIVKAALQQGSVVVEKQADTYASASVNNNALLSEILKANQAVTENKQTGTDVTTIRLVLYVAGGIAALLGAIFFFTRKSA